MQTKYNNLYLLFLPTNNQPAIVILFKHRNDKKPIGQIPHIWLFYIIMPQYLQAGFSTSGQVQT